MIVMKSTFRVLFYLKRNAQRKSGAMPIIARITVDGKIVQFSTKLEIQPNCWNIQLGKRPVGALKYKKSTPNLKI
jgi:hypothetical protein